MDKKTIEKLIDTALEQLVFHMRRTQASMSVRLF